MINKYDIDDYKKDGYTQPFSNPPEDFCIDSETCFNYNTLGGLSEVGNNKPSKKSPTGKGPYSENFKQEQGIKFDTEKPKLDLLDWAALNGLASVLTFGAQKYAADNWRNGIVNSRLIASLLRHLSAIQRGENIDSESGLPHIDHLGCCWMFLSNNFKYRPDLDDRYHSKQSR